MNMPQSKVKCPQCKYSVCSYTDRCYYCYRCYYCFYPPEIKEIKKETIKEEK